MVCILTASVFCVGPPVVEVDLGCPSDDQLQLSSVKHRHQARIHNLHTQVHRYQRWHRGWWCAFVYFSCRSMTYHHKRCGKNVLVVCIPHKSPGPEPGFAEPLLSPLSTSPCALCTLSCSSPSPVCWLLPISAPSLLPDNAHKDKFVSQKQQCGEICGSINCQFLITNVFFQTNLQRQIRNKFSKTTACHMSNLYYWKLTDVLL